MRVDPNTAATAKIDLDQSGRRPTERRPQNRIHPFPSRLNRNARSIPHLDRDKRRKFRGAGNPDHAQLNQPSPLIQLSRAHPMASRHVNETHTRPPRLANNGQLFGNAETPAW